MIEALLTYYLLLGQHHAAYWHGETPACAPPVVDITYYGVAACEAYPFGTLLRIEDIETGRHVYAVVIDRRARYTSEYCGYFDAWPATMDALGADARERGVLRVRVSIVERRSR